MDQDQFDYYDDDDGGPLDQIISEGFAAPADNDDPFRVQSRSTHSSGGNRGGSGANAPQNSTEPDTSFLPPINQVDFQVIKPAKTGKAWGGGAPWEESVPKSSPKKKEGKPFKILMPPTKATASAGSDDYDPEEERLKMLPDCCEFTAKRNDAFEIDEGRRDMSSDWLSLVKITPAQQAHLCFSESLLIVEESGVVVGKYYCTVSNSKWNGQPCFCVHAGSYGKFSTGLESGTTITSFINYNLKPLQEFVHEWASLDKDTIERKIFLMKEMEAMPCKILLLRNGKQVDSKSFQLGLRERLNLITEGSSILLQRFLILDRRTTGSMIIQSLSYTGKVVRAKYSELGSGWENVKGKQMKTWGIRRTVYCAEDDERVWDSLFNKNSRMILRCQPDSPQALIPLWFESILDFDKHGNFIGSCSPHTWACDAELYSKYCVKKEELVYDHRRYLQDHPEVRALLGDYLQAILFRKPQNVLEFTRQYFESFVNLKPPHQHHHHHHKSKKTTEMQSISSNYGSSYIFGEDESIGEGEWLGEGGEDGRSGFYPVNPTLNYDGLEQVDETGDGGADETLSDIPNVGGNETEDDLVVNEDGEYILRAE